MSRWIASTIQIRREHLSVIGEVRSLRPQSRRRLCFIKPIIRRWEHDFFAGRLRLTGVLPFEGRVSFEGMTSVDYPPFEEKPPLGALAAMTIDEAHATVRIRTTFGYKSAPALVSHFRALTRLAFPEALHAH